MGLQELDMTLQGLNNNKQQQEWVIHTPRSHFRFETAVFFIGYLMLNMLNDITPTLWWIAPGIIVYENKEMVTGQWRWLVQTLQRRKSLELVIQEGKKKTQYYVKKTVNTLAYANRAKSVVLRAKFSGRRGGTGSPCLDSDLWTW